MSSAECRLTIAAFLAALFVVALNGVSAAETQSADPHLASAIEHYRNAGAEAALPEFERLLARFREEDRANELISTTRYLGELNWRLGQFDVSRQFLEQAVALSRSNANRFEEAKSLNVFGLLEWDEGHYAAALENFATAQGIATGVGDPAMRASIINNRALVLDELGRYGESLAEYEKAHALFETADDPRGQGDALGNLGGVHLLAGRFRQALKFYEQALAISTRLGSKTSMTIDHGNLGLVFLGLGDYAAATRHFDAALRLAEETGMRIEEAYWQRGKAGAYASRGRYDEALSEYRAALEEARDISAPVLELDSLTDLGNLYLDLGDMVSARRAFTQASEIARRIGMPQGITVNLIALGDAEMTRGRAAEARLHFQQAVQRAAEAGEVSFEATALARLAVAERETGSLELAAASASRAAALAREAGAVQAEAEAWLALAEVARMSGRWQEARQAYDSAEDSANADPDLTWRIHHGRGRLLEDLGEKEQAIAELKKAVAVIEGVRVGLSSKRYRSGWMQNKSQVYMDLVRLQLSLGRQSQAFMSGERLRAQVYLAMIGDSGFRGRTEQQRQEESILRARIRQLSEALNEERSVGSAGRRQAAIDYFSSELVEAERQFVAFLEDLGESHTSEAAAALPPFNDIQATLRPSEALIEYLVAEDGLIVFVLRRDALHAFSQPTGHHDLSTTVSLLRELIATSDNGDWSGPAARLASILLGFLSADDVLASVEHLVIVPHGVLNYVPFAALPSPSQPDRLLVDDFTLTYLPAAAARVLGPEIGEVRSSILAMAPLSARLRYAPGEARSVASIFRQGATLLEGRDATESAFKRRASHHRVIHLATHGLFNPINPLLSAVELEADESNDGMLEVHEILGLTLEADLVTLSACETALGSGWLDRLPAGNEFVGLARAFMQAGSRNILASLWEVDDRSTVSLMEGFYRGLAPDGGGLEKAVALARAQRELRTSRQYSHPFYWAPFILMGNSAWTEPDRREKVLL